MSGSDTFHGLVHVAAMSKLRELHIANVNITDVGLRQLEGMKGLNVLSVGGTKVTAAGVQRLKKALPKLQVNF